jgi:hypothetical protein
MRALLLSFIPSLAFAQTFQYGKVEEVEKVKLVEWKAQAKAGLVHTTGNARTTTITAAGSAERKAGDNKLAAEAGVAYARASLLTARDANANMIIDSQDELDRTTAISARAFFLRGRYDRFFTKHNSVYLSGRLEGDRPAGKELIGGGQIGYSRELYTDACRLLLTEVGYDLTYEDYVAKGDVLIHSARGFVGYTTQVGISSEFLAQVELLLNLNREETMAGGVVEPFEDVRVNGKTGLTTQLWTDISFAVTFTLKYDAAPAPLPPFGGFMVAPGVLAEELDTITEATLIVNFL